MAAVSFTQSCDVHFAHSHTEPVNCFGEASAMALMFICEFAIVDEIPSIALEWSKNDGTETFEISFEDDLSGAETVLTFTV